MKAIANELGFNVYRRHQQRMGKGKMFPDNAEMVRIFEDWWALGDLYDLPAEEALDKLWEVLQKKVEGLRPLAKRIENRRTKSSNNAPRPAPEGFGSVDKCK